MTISSTQPHLWGVPYLRNPFFTGREGTLRHLHQALKAENAAALSHPQGISGLGGIGKTQTALEYAYRYGAEYHAVLWVRADTPAALISSFVELAHLPDVPERDEQDQGIIVEAVLRWLHRHTGWLLIFDGMDDFPVAEPFLPKAGPGYLLFTTRAYALGGIAQRLEVQKMEPEVGALLLLRRASILPLQATLDSAAMDDRSVASEVSQEVDGLLLALDQAGAYVKETPCTLADYLALYRTRHSGILRTRGSLDKDYPASVATTWSLSFEKVTQANPAVAELLDLCAFLAPDAIPEEMIAGGTSHLGPCLQRTASGPLLFNQSIAALLAYSLVARNADDRVLNMHRLVQVVLRDAMPAETAKQWKQRSVYIVNTAFPDEEFVHWTACERCLSHALLCATWIEQEQMVFPEAARLLNEAGSYLRERARYVEAEPLAQRALAIREQQLGLDHPDTAISLNDLAALYDNQGKYEQAKPLLVRALAIRERQSGPLHPFTAISLTNLATLHIKQGRYKQAEPLLLRALAVSEQQLGPEHPDIAIRLNNLASLYESQGRYEQAELLLLRALAIFEQQLGPEHPNIATSLNNLASLYKSQGKYEQAKTLYQRVLAIFEQQPGSLHSNTATSLNNLAHLYEDQGRYEQAEPLLLRALAIRERQLGPLHPDTDDSFNNLASLYQRQGRYEQAEPLLQRALTLYEQQLGPLHPATGLNNLAHLYWKQGRYEQAEPLLQRALAIREQQLDPDHPDTARSLNNLASLSLSEPGEV